MQQVVGLNHQRYKSLLEWLKLTNQTFFDLTSELTILRSGLHLRLSPTRLTIVELTIVGDRDYPAGVIEGKLEIRELPLPGTRIGALVFRGTQFRYELWVSGFDPDVDEIQIVHQLMRHIEDGKTAGREAHIGIWDEAHIYDRKIYGDQARQFRRVLAAAKAKFEQKCNK